MKIIIKNLLTKSFKNSFQHHIILEMYQSMKASNPPKQNSNLQSKAYEITEHNGRVRWEHRFLFPAPVNECGARKGREKRRKENLG